MNWEPFVGTAVAVLMSILTQWLASAKLGTRLETEAKEKDRRIGECEVELKEHRKALDDFKERARNDFAGRGELEKVEQRLGGMMERVLEPIKEQLKELTHNLKNVDTKLDNRVVAMMRVAKGRDAE